MHRRSQSLHHNEGSAEASCGQHVSPFCRAERPDVPLLLDQGPPPWERTPWNHGARDAAQAGLLLVTEDVLGMELTQRQSPQGVSLRQDANHQSHNHQPSVDKLTPTALKLALYPWSQSNAVSESISYLGQVQCCAGSSSATHHSAFTTLHSAS